MTNEITKPKLEALIQQRIPRTSNGDNAFYLDWKISSGRSVISDSISASTKPFHCTGQWVLVLSGRVSLKSSLPSATSVGRRQNHRR
jgi:hypothetical protein